MSETYSFGPFLLQPAERLLLRGGKPVALTPKAFDTLHALILQPGHVLTRDELLTQVWPDAFVEENTLAQNISLLRKTLGTLDGAEFIETVPKRGYRFAADVTAVAAAAHTHASIPETHYARSGDLNIAYQVLGSGPVDLVFVMGWVSHLEYFWTEPSFARFLRRLATFSRVILFDKRGTGLSDRVPLAQLPTLEQRMDDVRAVMEAAGSERAVICGVSEGGPMSALFAATYPQRTAALVMIGTYAKRIRDDNYPWGPTEEQRGRFLDEIRKNWGGPVGIDERAPSAAHDQRFRDWWAAYLRMGASPGAALAITTMNSQIDVRGVLPSVRVPALVVHRRDDQCLRVEEGRFVASLIPGARFVELPGADHLPFVGDQEAILTEIENFVAALEQPAEPDRVLATVLFLRGSDRLPLAEIEHFGGQPIAGASAAAFDGPARAIRCATAIAAVSRELSAGLHTGECERLDGRLSGPAVGIAAEIAALSAPGQVIVSRTVRDLVAGSGLHFVPAGLAVGELELWQVS